MKATATTIAQTFDVSKNKAVLPARANTTIPRNTIDKPRRRLWHQQMLSPFHNPQTTCNYSHHCTNNYCHRSTNDFYHSSLLYQHFLPPFHKPLLPASLTVVPATINKLNKNAVPTTTTATIGQTTLFRHSEKVDPTATPASLEQAAIAFYNGITRSAGTTVTNHTAYTGQQSTDPASNSQQNGNEKVSSQEKNRVFLSCP
jgi:hypothetical protein